MARVFRALTRTWRGRAGVVGLVGLHQYDTHFRYARFNRNVRSVSAAVLTLIDYKFTTVGSAERLDELHERVAKRWYDLCCVNAGLYIKLGQQIATLNHILPAPYLKYFSQLNDQAPSVSYDVVSRIVCEDFGVRSIDEVFDDFEREPMASASIAQVHKARMKDGREVAVKVQKPEIAVQLPWDLACFKLLVFCFEKIFDLPMYWTVSCVCDVLVQESDFRCEGRNAELVKDDFAFDKRVHVPAVYWEATTRRVMAMEWIQGHKVSDLTALRKDGFNIAKIAKWMVEAFSHQIFISGFVHADPHPGNILVRRIPGTNTPQLVLLDHGCYLSASEEFRLEYCRLWKAMVLTDQAELHRICKAWGIHDSEFFASMQLLKPYRPEKGGVHLHSTSRGDVLRLQLEAYERVKRLLQDSKSVPRELILLGRNLNIVRANNKGMGSPVNRVNVMAFYASKGLGTHAELDPRRAEWLRARIEHQPTSEMKYPTESSRRQRGGSAPMKISIASTYWESIAFQSRLLVITCIYYASQLWGKANALILGRRVGGFEEVLEESIAQTIEAKLGLKLNFDAGVERCFG